MLKPKDGNRHNARSIAGDAVALWLILTIVSGAILSTLALLRSPPWFNGEPFGLTWKYNTLAYDARSTSYDLVMVADLDHLSAGPGGGAHRWQSILKLARLEYDPALDQYRYEAGREYALLHGFRDPGLRADNDGDRGLELSDAVYFQDTLYACDDRTGVVYEIRPGSGRWPGRPQLIPRWSLRAGTFGWRHLKCEWMTVKDRFILVGASGCEFVNDGRIVHTDNTLVKKIDPVLGSMSTLDWRDRYDRLRKTVGASFPGYLTHEAVEWSAHLQRWLFLPRKHSRAPYDERLDEMRGANLLLTASEDFSEIQVLKLAAPTTLSEAARGFSSVKVVPHRESDLLCLKTYEVDGVMKSYLQVIDSRSGRNKLAGDDEISLFKFEGIEFAPRAISWGDDRL